MEKKYIVELPENTHWIQWIMEGTEDHHPYMDYKTMEDLMPYTEPDLAQVRKEAYDKGYMAAYVKSHMETRGSYQQCLNDAWEAARRLLRMPESDILYLFPECYSAVCTPAQVILKYDAREVIDKLNAYEAQKEQDVSAEIGKALNDFVERTGFAMAEIAEVLQKMQEDN